MIVTELLTATEITTLSGLLDLMPEWDSLAALDARDGYCRTAAWYICWLRCLMPSAEPCVIAVRDANRLVGVAPLCRVRQNRYLTALCLGGSHTACGDYLDIPSLPGMRAEVLATVFDRIAQLKDTWDLLLLPDTNKDSDLLVRAGGRATAEGWQQRVHDRQICPYIELPGSYDDFVRDLSSKRRKDLRRRQDSIVEQMGATLQVYSQGQELEDALDRLIDLHLARWRAAGDPGTLGKPGFREFLMQLSKTGICAGSFRLYMLRHQGREVAGLLNFHFGESALQFQSGWDPGSPLAKHSPGTLLIFHAIKEAIEEGRKYYDFLRGDEEYKFRYTTLFRENLSCMYGRNLAARAYLSTLGMKDLARASAGSIRGSIRGSARIA